MEVIKITTSEADLSILVPEKLARKYNLFPMELYEDSLIIGIEEENIYASQDLKLVTGKNIILKQVSGEEVLENIELCYGDSIDIDDDYANYLFQDILQKAVKEKASDIHIEPFSDLLKIRMRVDGNMKEMLNLELDLYPPLSSVVKYKANMDITEKRLPQDGRIDVKIKDSLIDIRISTVPTTYGEKIVLRLLSRDSFLKTKEELGFSKDAIEKIQEIINKKTGILLVTGPTGSGKTTTVYSILKNLRNISKNIMTIEDPIEYKMEGINQIQVNHKVGLTFEKGLKAILRQDPDIIMVGEIRDIETAKTAVRAAITGHLVISTLHTNDAVSSIARLIDMEIPPYLLNASLIGIISQRLVRKVCENCSNEVIINQNEKKTIYTAIPIGCEECSYTGYNGRTVAFEILSIDDEIRNGIQKNKEAKDIKNIAVKNGMIAFEDTYSYLIKNKITTLEECIMSKEIIN
ncbi:GspE/PulE family protein [Terrisporobacter glycolicus]|uniref:Bacterial type II secretion system protein E domain-containing protein n=1 Tax=Terrisporobacter glycolicus ATCC 14880 = DSM 1288 TaxID=1121315 RepID=A0ABZ2EQY9_9FIRM|nr:GspE/PulE family protein [Terrisporobacter glycolicus]